MYLYTFFFLESFFLLSNYQTIVCNTTINGVDVFFFKKKKKRKSYICWIDETDNTDKNDSKITC